MKNNLNSIVFSIAIVIAAIVLGNAYLSRTKSGGTISVTGLGKTDFTSDLIVWQGRFEKESKDLKKAYLDLEIERL